MSQPRSYTLSQFAALLGNAIRRDPQLQGAWVFAELSDFRVGPGGHCYMELIEKDQRGTTVAKMRANMWGNTAASVMPRFQAATGRALTSGLKVMMYGSVTHHPNYGLSFSIAEIDPSFTLGDLERLRREILMRLHKEGVLQYNKSLPVPVAPQRIAVISSPTAAGYGDFINHLTASAEGFVFYPHLVPALMQGENTGGSVIEALDFVESTIDLWDMVVIIRGGGSTTDLNGFDDYDLARRVATFPLPIIVGIGHERDRTVLDDIAAVRCKTPTAVAGWLNDRLREALTKAMSLADRIAGDAAMMMQAETRRFSSLEAMVPVLVQKRVEVERSRLEVFLTQVERSGAESVRREEQRIDFTLSMFERNVTERVKREQQRLDGIAAVVGVLDPKATLSRGFSITRVNGKAVMSAGDLNDGDILETLLADGVVKSEVKQ